MYYLVCAKVKEKSELLNILVMNIEKTRVRLFVESYLVPSVIVLFAFAGLMSLWHWYHSFYFGVHVCLAILVLTVLVVSFDYIDERYLHIHLSKTGRIIIKLILTLFFLPASLVVFFVVCPLVFLLVVKVHKKYPRAIYVSIYYMATTLLFTAGAFPQHVGNFKIFYGKDGKNYVVIFEHASFIDYLLAAHALGYKNPWKIVIGTNLLKWPIFGKYIKLIGIFVERGNIDSEVETSELIQKALNDGYTVGIFAGGGRNKDGIPKPFKNGAFKAALALNKTIIPVALTGSARYCPAGPPSKYRNPKVNWFHYFKDLLIETFENGLQDYQLILPGRIHLKVLDEIPLTRLNEQGEVVLKTRQELKNETFNAIYPIAA